MWTTAGKTGRLDNFPLPRGEIIYVTKQPDSPTQALRDRPVVVTPEMASAGYEVCELIGPLGAVPAHDWLERAYVAMRLREVHIADSILDLHVGEVDGLDVGHDGRDIEDR